MERADTIELSLPYKAEYVSIARLTASGVASRVGFDIDTVEDIKVAVSEVCSKLISIVGDKPGSYRIIFSISEETLTIMFDGDDEITGCIFGDGDEELGMSIINALMDSVEYCRNKGYILTMSKAIEGNI